MNPIQRFGAFFGRIIMQTRGSIGGSRNVFVKLKGQAKDDLVFPTFGGKLMNPFLGPAKFFAGDLFEFRLDENGVNPELYLLKTYEVVSASGTTVNILRDNFRHKPFVGDVLMVAPDELGGNGTAVTVTAVTETTVKPSTVTYDVWQLTVSSTLGSLDNGVVLVEAEEAGENKPMLVKMVNSVAPSDGDMVFAPDTTSNEGYDGPRSYYSPALGGLMYTSKMSPIPNCVKKLNKSNINGWFKIGYYGMLDQNTENLLTTVKLLRQEGAADPTTATVGMLGSIYVNTTDNGVFVCNAISGGATPSYTWSEVTVS
jgi:hypothetical protein